MDYGQSVKIWILRFLLVVRFIVEKMNLIIKVKKLKGLKMFWSGITAFLFDCIFC